MQKEALKELLAVPSYFNQEHQMIEKIKSLLGNIPGIQHWSDIYGNIYVVKGESEIYPLICAHTDTVHEICDYDVVEVERSEGTCFQAFNKSGDFEGIGGDNKTGIFTCLEVLKVVDTLKVVFFVAEEYGGHGSVMADPEFFTNVGYCLTFDAPDFYWVSHHSGGIKLFDHNGDFWRTAGPIMVQHCDGLQDPYNNNHPFTDIFHLKGFYDFSCLNYSSGYMRMHSTKEYVVVEYVFKAINTAIELIGALGVTKYPYTSKQLDRSQAVERRKSFIHHTIKG